MSLLWIIVGTVIIYFPAKYLFGEPGDINTKKNNRIAGYSILLALALFFLKGWVGAETPGSWLEKDHYKREFYVNLFTDRSASKNYRLPGLIEATYESTDDEEGRTQSWRAYYLEWVNFPNGGRTTFYENPESLKLHRKVSLIDDSGQTWYVELTNERVK